jgi:DNA-binding MarR family transcriptional regulator
MPSPAKHSHHTPELPLHALLSQALVAFTIEFDNEAEHQLPHRTTEHGSTGGFHTPWLVSLAMYANCMQHIGPEGITIGDLVRRARAMTNFRGMTRWGYITLRPGPESKSKKPDATWLVNATAGGRIAQEVWRPQFDVIENRWRERFGNQEIIELRDSLQTIVAQLDPSLPDCLPILGYGLGNSLLKKKTTKKKRTDQISRESESPATLPLSALLSKVLLTFAIEFEFESDVSLAICANVLRLIDKDVIRLRDLPTMSGVSTESISMATTFLKGQGYATVETDPSGRPTKILRLTAKGKKAKATYPRLIFEIEARWQERFGKTSIENLRNALQDLAGDSTSQSPLFVGLTPYPENWRAKVPKPETLPHFPMVLHRGGYPDGS